MPVPTPPCPVCGQTDQVEKVSAIYVEGSSINPFSRKKELPIAKDGSPRLTHLSPQQLFVLSRELKPPAGQKGQVTRLINPDLVILVFSGIVPIFLAGIARTERPLLLPVLLVLLVFYGLYAFRRKSLLAQYHNRIAEQQSERQVVEKQIKNWMRLYYCVRDEGVFLPGSSELSPVQDYHDLLVRR
jgi:hypothetical protein